MEKEILDLLRKQNRPFSLQTVINFTESKYSKTKVQQALNDLVEQALITYLEVGKSGKLYFFNQEKLQVLSGEEESALRKEIDATERTIEQLLNERISKYNVCQSFFNRLTVAEYEKRISDAREALAKFSFDENYEIITDDVMEAAKALCTKRLKAWKARQYMVKDALEMLADGVQKSPKELRAELALEATKTSKEIVALLVGLK